MFLFANIAGKGLRSHSLFWCVISGKHLKQFNRYNKTDSSFIKYWLVFRLDFWGYICFVNTFLSYEMRRRLNAVMLIQLLLASMPGDSSPALSTFGVTNTKPPPVITTPTPGNLFLNIVGHCTVCYCNYEANALDNISHDWLIFIVFKI